MNTEVFFACMHTYSCQRERGEAIWETATADVHWRARGGPAADGWLRVVVAGAEVTALEGLATPPALQPISQAPEPV